MNPLRIWSREPKYTNSENEGSLYARMTPDDYTVTHTCTDRVIASANTKRLTKTQRKRIIRENRRSDMRPAREKELLQNRRTFIV